MMPDSLIQFIVFGPGVAALLTGLFRRFISDRGTMVITTVIVGLAGLLSLYQLFTLAAEAHTVTATIGKAGPHIAFSLPWMHVGAFEADWAIRVDTLSIVMMAVVTGVSSLVHIYSWGYMQDDPGRGRFFSYLSLFTFAMLMLVTADDFIQLFFGWEGVGLASYLLIGFWHHNKAPNEAAIKAFVTNRVGDFGLALGIMAVFVIFGSVKFEPVLTAIRDNAILVPFALAEPGPVRDLIIAFPGGHMPVLDLIGILLFIGAMGKSAQFLLHVWLPDAMEGPTPVSALIHAATMVTAGVYLVCLISPVYEYAPVAAGFVTLVGAVTALFAATVAVAQNDIKRVIAYSTCSQLGYMFFAAGTGAYQAAMFHLFTHAFFKALLFLGAGSVIHGAHHEQDMRNLGGLARYMPLTYGAMMIGTIAIIGIGIPHIWGFAGFYSKDAIIESAFAASRNGIAFAGLAFWFSILAAFLTSFYSWRLICMTFHGPCRQEAERGDPHESPLNMLIPLAALSLGAIFAGWLFSNAFLGHDQKSFWSGAIYTTPDNTILKDKYNVPLWVIWAPLVVTLAGFVLALSTYGFNRGIGQRIANSGGPIYNLVANKWYFDEIYNATLVRGAALLGNAFRKADKKLVDGIGPDGIAASIRWGARRIAALHTGYLYHYALVMIAAALVFGAILFWNGGDMSQ